MGMLDSIMQMFKGGQQTPQAQQQPQMRANKGATTKALSTRDAYMQYQMEMQSAGIEALPYEAWIQQQAEMAKQQKQ